MSLARAAAAPLRRAALARAAPAARAFSTASADGVKVAAADDGSQTSSITVAIKAGPRYETSAGVAHILKNFTFKSTAQRSALRLIREAELYGGLLSSSLSKEHLFLTAEFLRGDEDFFVQVLGEVLSSSKLLQHEFQEEVLPSVASEFSSVQASPAALAFDAFTQAAYRQRGLGASLYASPITPVSHEAAVSFARAAFAKSNLAVLGSGIEAGALASLVSKHFAGVASSGSVAAGTSKYFGGDARIAYAPAHSDSPRASDGHVVLGFEGAALGSPELAVLRAHLGGEAAVKWSAGLSPLAALSAGHPGVQANAFNLGFSDSGLFGAHISAPHAKIGEAAQATAQAFKKAADSISSEDLSRAVAKAKFEAAAALESRTNVQAVAGAQLLSGSQVTSLEETFSKLEGVKANALSSAAGKLLKSKPTLVVVGDVHKLPYADELF